MTSKGLARKIRTIYRGCARPNGPCPECVAHVATMLDEYQRATFRKCLKIASAERVSLETGEHSDVVYNRAIRHVCEAIKEQAGL